MSIDPRWAHRYALTHERDPLTLRDVILSIAILAHPTSAVIRMAARGPRRPKMSTHRTAKQEFSRLTDGERHPVTVRQARPVVDLDNDPHTWGAFGDHPLSSIVGTDHLGEVNPEPQKVLVAQFDVAAPAMSPSLSSERRPGIPVPQMDPMHPIGHVDAIANTHGDDR